MNSKLLGSLIILTLVSHSLCAEPVPLVIDESQNKASTKYIKVAHDVINHNLPAEELRFKILQATLSVKSAKWIMEEDADNYILVRWDYGRKVLYTKIEYNTEFVQLKYSDKNSDFKCINDINGICYKNSESDYYSYLKRLRVAIKSSIQTKGAR